MYHYAPLKSHLSALNVERVSMTFMEVERVLGRPLPPSARGKSIRQWWANTDTHSQAKAWLEAGRIAKLDAEREAVTFVRSSRMSTTAETDRTVVVSRDQLTPAAIRLLEDIAEEQGVGLGAAMTSLLNQAALRRRRETLDWFAQNTLVSKTTSAELIRADRDAH
jgi:hypothetical protein